MEINVHAKVWYNAEDTDTAAPFFEVGGLEGARALMDDFMARGWYKIEFYTNGIHSHTVSQNPDGVYPVITEHFVFDEKG